jgi:hypothetical protein
MALGWDAHRHEPLTLLSLQAGVPIALANAGNNRAANIAMTTSSSINVNAPNRLSSSLTLKSWKQENTPPSIFGE